MSDRGSPADHTDTVIDTSKDDGQASPTPEVVPPTDGKDANSPAGDPSKPADQGAKKDAKPTLMEVIRTAVDKPTDQGKSPNPANDGKDKVDPAASAAKAAKPTEADDKKLSFHNHPRWQEVTGQNKQLKEQVSSLTPDADQYRKIHGFMTEHKLTPDEVGEGFIIMAMAKNGDPRVLQKLDDLRGKIALAIGEAVPTDIQEKIDSGEISEAAGKELAKSRANLKANESREAERTQQTKRDEAIRAADALATAQASAVSAWDLEARKLDPDFAKKEKAIARYAKALMQEHGPPRTAADAVSLVKAAYAEVNRDFAAAIPAKTAVARVPIAPSSNGAKTAPKTLREAIAQAAAG